MSDALEFWRSFDFESFKRVSDDFIGGVGDSQKKSAESRRRLAEATRGFSGLPATEKLQSFGGILKQYQIEIDALTKRARKAERAFATSFRPLLDAPDPSDAFKSASEASAPSGDRQAEMRELKDKLQQYKEEFTKLKNQDFTIRRLRDQLSKSSATVEQTISSRVASAKREYEAARAEREEEITESKKRLEKRLEESNLRCDDLQSRIFELQKQIDEESTNIGSQEEISSDASEQYRLKALMLEKENAKLREAFANVQHNTTGPTKEEIDARDDERRRMYKNMQEQITVARAANVELEEKVKSLQAEKEIAAKAHAETKAQLTLRPSRDELRVLRKKLAAFQAIEFITVTPGLDSGAERDAQSSSTDGDLETWASALVSRKMRKLHEENAKMRARLTDLESKLADSEKRCRTGKERLQDATQLIGRLEEDIARGSTRGVGVGIVTATATAARIAKSSAEKDVRGAAINVGDIDEDTSMISILKAQRDRFRQRMAVLEAKEERRSRAESALRTEVKKLRDDNVALFEKIRFLQSYRNQRSLEEGLPSVSNSIRSRADPDSSINKYEKMYIEKNDPFVKFRKQEMRKRYANLSTSERVALTSSKLLLLNKFTRYVFFVYALALHLLVSYTLLHHAHKCEDSI